MGLENIAPYNLKPLDAQPAAAWQSFITWSAGIPSSSQQSCADATTTLDAVGSSFGTANAPAIGSIANDRATRKATMVWPMRMQLTKVPGISIGPIARSSDDFASRSR